MWIKAVNERDAYHEIKLTDDEVRNLEEYLSKETKQNVKVESICFYDREWFAASELEEFYCDVFTNIGTFKVDYSIWRWEDRKVWSLRD